MSFADQADRTLDILALTPGWHRLKELREDCDDETVAAIIGESASFAEGVLAPLNAVGDRIGARMVDGRVRTPDGFADAFRQYAEAGWLGMDVAEKFGGQAVPLTLHAACAPLFERGCVALMMAAGSTRAAAHLLAEAADEATANEWVPKLSTGEWAATICISEPEAGSDVGRLRTKAELSDREWLITGQKIWISFGDHDMATRIGHCLLARTNDQPGTRGISLFLVPNLIDGQPNGVSVDRIEEKMGLHGSPTCAMRFDNAQGTMLGREGRGLPQLFTMIELMRLLTGCQGLGIASAAADIAEDYAKERRQGGRPDQPPVPISSHPDVQRQLHEIRSSTEILRAAILELATTMDIARLEPESGLEDFTGWMLPLIKNFGAAAGFETANAAIQVLGGVGYTRDWPLEQYLRDARIMTIYEGTTGMQALDFLTRRLWRDKGRGLALFLEKARDEIDAYIAEHPAASEQALAALDGFERLSGRMTELQSDPDAALYRADSYMRAAWSAVSIWMALRISETGAVRRLAAEFDFHSARCG
ncbi:acyl-CoA dehydrogenase family protein [Neorhizobium sp. BETTINA12A]|uniref:acyl-CoA dehydrogenase family protein n=1 Tax=Neorhizobium sp. BETTINA12A TaxID=2908924 RepID=UPI001FF3C7F3|nr:acyl-CoA dehydrogenase family protein [Neorhizobium sp. BETTINA12A]MCJ9750328.1 acyl-CoA dehydrogenase family protein [Neorhizobium sp. BETTINA12A]